MQTPYTIEELVINDSFINYCFARNEEDIRYWEEYLLQNPGQKHVIEDAKLLVGGVFNMFVNKEKEVALAELKTAVSVKYSSSSKDMAEVVTLPSKRNIARKLLWYAAAFTAAVSVFVYMYSMQAKDSPVVSLHPDQAMENSTQLFETAFGEKKTIILPDSSKVVLNAKSTLIVDAHFGTANRIVQLTGEALFDVKYSAQSPFLVKSDNFEVKVLGTLFNVKAYKEDAFQETSLLRGKVEVVMHNNHDKTFFLKPSEKIVLVNRQNNLAKDADQKDNQKPSAAPVIMPITINHTDQSVVETSWVYGRLDISDKTFIQIKPELERLFNVSIVFTDSDVAGYRFSATFENESIEQVLSALQLSYPFSYTFKDKIIRISK